METGRSSKPKFDKKKWREKKYNKAFQVNKWEERRQKILLRKLHNELKKENLTPNAKVEKNTFPSKQRSGGVKAALTVYQKIKQEKERKREEKLKKEKEKQEALERYKKKRTETYMKLSKKTKKGQPLMKERMELLLQKVEECVNS